MAHGWKVSHNVLASQHAVALLYGKGCHLVNFRGSLFAKTSGNLEDGVGTGRAGRWPPKIGRR